MNSPSISSMTTTHDPNVSTKENKVRIRAVDSPYHFRWIKLGVITRVGSPECNATVRINIDLPHPGGPYNINPLVVRVDGVDAVEDDPPAVEGL
jgi:hypothetical protein